MSFKQLNSDDFLFGTVNVSLASSNGGAVQAGEVDTGTATLGTPGTSADQKYRQFANIIQGDSTSNLPKGSSFTYTSFKRKYFNGPINPYTFNVNGVYLKTGSADVNYCEAGREYVSTNGSFYLYPDIGLVIGSGPTSMYATYDQIETRHTAFISAGSSEFNYSMNPTFADKDGYVRFPEWVRNPVVYITTIGFYNDNGDLLAVAKTGKPIEKSPHKPVLFQVNFNF